MYKRTIETMNAVRHMSSTVVSLSTTTSPAALRPDYWAQVLGSLCGRLSADGFGATTIDGHVDYAAISRLRLCNIEVSRHRISHPAPCARSGGPEVVKVLFQTFGISIFEQDGRRYVIAPGDGLAYDVTRPHVITSLALTKHHVVIIPRQLLEQRGIPPERLFARHFSAREGAARLAKDFALSAFDQAPSLSSGCEQQVSDAFLDLLLPFFGDGSGRLIGRDVIVSRVKTLIRENLSNPELSIDQISSAMKCTKRYLHMSFADESTTITEYIWQQRLERCLKELQLGRSSGKTVTDIAFSWGFSSSSHFAHLFKKRYGMPASLIQRQSRPTDEPKS